MHLLLGSDRASSDDLGLTSSGGAEQSIAARNIRAPSIQFLLIANNDSLSVAENSGATRLDAILTDFYMLKQPGHLTSMK